MRGNLAHSGSGAWGPGRRGVRFGLPHLTVHAGISESLPDVSVDKQWDHESGAGSWIAGQAQCNIDN